MSITSSILIASSGLRGVTAALTAASQNVANASTPSYARESVALSTLNAGSQGLGVNAGPATRTVDVPLEGAVFEQNAAVAGQQVTSAALAKLDATQGTTAAGNDLASQVGALTDAFTGLGADPANAAGQGAVVIAATTLATTINQTAAAYQDGRQAAQDSLGSQVSALNAALAQVGVLSHQIVAARGQGLTTADLENQRDGIEDTAAQLAGIRFLPQVNGDVVALAGGNQVDLTAASGPFSIGTATLSAQSAGPPLLLEGQDVSAAVTSGQIGANLALRDTTLPAAQAGLDEFAQTLATRFDNQGLRLFTDPQGAVPAGGGVPAQSTYLGFSGVIQVNPAVIANPAAVRDGTQAVAAGTGGAAGFTPNPAGGPAGFTTLIDTVLTYALGSNAQAGVAQAAPLRTGLGADGTVTLPYETSNTLAGFAANLVSAQSTAVNAAATALSTGASLQATLQSKLQAGSGVSIDSELSNLIVLQNAYGANAKVLAAAQSLWSDLFSAVTAVQ